MNNGDPEVGAYSFVSLAGSLVSLSMEITVVLLSFTRTLDGRHYICCGDTRKKERERECVCVCQGDFDEEKVI